MEYPVLSLVALYILTGCDYVSSFDLYVYKDKVPRNFNNYMSTGIYAENDRV